MKESPDHVGLRFWLELASVLLLCWTAAVQAQELTQTFNLQPGWNAVYLEVELADRRLDPIFTNLPVSRVCTWKARHSAADFIQDLNEQLDQQEKWLMYYAKSQPESRFNTLFALIPRRAYLIKLTGNAPVTLELRGRPSLRQPDWVPNSYNLRGFPIDPQTPPTFRNFFKFSPAHYDAAQGGLQPIYRLKTAGRWEAVQPDEPMQRGEAYWVYTRAASEYAGPVSLELVGAGDGLDYDTVVSEFTLRFNNRCDHNTSITLRDYQQGQLPLSYHVFPYLGPTANWRDLPSPCDLGVAPGQTQVLRLAVRRAAIPATGYSSVIEVRDSAGTLIYVPVSAQRAAANPGASLMSLASLRGGRRPQAQPPATSDYAGLWVGSVTVNAVSEPNGGTLVTNEYITVITTNASGTVVTNLRPQQVIRVGVTNTPTPTKATFDLRLIVHVDGTGNARLLPEVTVMRRPATYTNDPASGLRVEATPGVEVLVTDPARLAEFDGAGFRNGVWVGRRLSSVHFPVPGARELALSGGTFGPAGHLTGTIDMPATWALNPYLHRYHPDHDNKDATFRYYRAEAYAVQRQLELEFAEGNPGGTGPDYGYETLAGVYREQVTGLHREPIYCSGAFKLQRVSHAAELNPAMAWSPAGGQGLRAQSVNR